MTPLPVFLHSFISKLDQANIKHCVLRNYEGLPATNDGNDIDLLIPKNKLEDALNILFSLEKITITSLVHRQSVTTLFVYPITWGEDRKGIQIDLITSIDWKGIPYIDAARVLNSSTEITSSAGLLNRPSIYHEAIISLFSSYLVGGWIKGRYQQKIRQTFTSHSKILIQELQTLPPKIATQLTDAIIEDNQKLMLSLLSSIRFWIFVKKFRLEPFGTLKNIFNHYFYEFKIRYTQQGIISICFLGPDGAGKSTVINELKRNLRDTVKEISYVHLKPQLNANKTKPTMIVNDPHSEPVRNPFVSVAKIILWLLLYRYDHIFHKHRCTAIRIWDRHYTDVYIDPKRYRFGAPIWIAKLIGVFIPKPDIYFVLDAPAEVIEARKKEMPLAEIQKQRNEYLKFARRQGNCIILDTSIEIDETVKLGTDTIISFMKKKLNGRFKIDRNG